MSTNGTRAALLQQIPCLFCEEWRGATLNDRATHQLACHERPLPPADRLAWIWRVTPPKKPVVTPNWRARSLSDWYGAPPAPEQGEQP